MRGVSGVNSRCVRCWSFANCVFDEANWMLTVAGRRVAVESKPLELLRELLLNAGNLVSKADLLDAIWPDTAVVEASLPTAIHKLRLALGDDGRDSPIIETVPRIGYRLAVAVEVIESSDAPAPQVTLRYPAGGNAARQAETVTPDRRRTLVLGSGVAIGALLVAVALWPSQKVAAGLSAPPVAMSQPARPAAARLETDYLRQWDVATALRKMDLAKIEAMLAAGWNPTTPFDDQNNGALNMLLNNCEWDPGHDQRKMLLVARTLIDGGESIDKRNAWGDTPYSIAKADRYCGPDHPVTMMLHRMCYASPLAPGDRCLAQYKASKSARGAAKRGSS